MIQKAQGRPSPADSVQSAVWTTWRQFTRDNLLQRDRGIVALDWAVRTRLGVVVERKRWGARKEHLSGGKTRGCFTDMPLVVRQCFYVMVFHTQGQRYQLSSDHCHHQCQLQKQDHQGWLYNWFLLLLHEERGEL